MKGFLRYYSILFIALALTACREHEDLEDFYFNTVDQRFDKTFYDQCGSVSPMQDWNTVKDVKVSITLPEVEGQCKVLVLSADPSITFTHALLLAEYDELNPAAKYELQVDAPSYLDSLYVLVQTDNRAVVKKIFPDERGAASLQVDALTQEVNHFFYDDMQYLLAYEDLGIAIDIDFNDVVLCVTHVSGRKQAIVRLYALGTTLYTNIYFNGEHLYDERELHEFYGISNNTLVNVFSSEDVFTNNMRNESRYLSSSFAHNILTVDLPEGFSMAKDASLFEITTSAYSGNNLDKTKTISFSGEPGKFPRVLLIANPDWQWPSETTPVYVAYPSFKEWVAEPSNNNWYK